MRRIARWWWLLSMVLGVGITVALSSAYLFSNPRPTLHNASQGPNHRRQPNFPVLTVDIPPIEQPVLVPAASARIHDEAIVIGVVIAGEPRAYLRDAFALGPVSHIVRDSIRSVPIAVTHCDRLRCTRVFTNKKPAQPLSIRVGGWREDQTMDLIIGGSRYSQKSPLIPLADIPFSEATWGTWREQHPDTLIYVGGYRDT